MVFPLAANAARTINSATLNGASSVTVAPGAAITAVVNVTTDGSGSAARWRSTGWLISTTAPGTVTCVDHPNHDGAGAYSETFSITAPATSGTYNAYFIAYNNDSCSSGASATSTMASAVTVVDNPFPTTTSIFPASKNVGDGAFTMTVNGTNFVSGSVVQFAGSSRTTTYVSAAQVTAQIPASDLTALGAFAITVFNPTPGGGTSNAQTFTVNSAPPTATTNAATGVTSAVATLNGTVSSNGGDTTVTFEYGLTAAYGNSIAATPSPLAADAVNTAVSAELVGLNCNTVFHYRAVATNSTGTGYGADGTLTTGICTAPFPATACAATRFNGDLGCTANDVNITGITLAPNSIASCVSGTPVSLDLDITVNFASPNRWDVGIFIANDGKLPTLLPANGGAGSCSVDILPTTAPFLDLDGVPQGTLDTCGDGNSSIDDSALPGGTVPLGDGVKRMSGVTLPCYASPASGGKLFVPFAVSWDNQKSPIGNLCTSNLYPVPNTKSKCNAPASSVSINVVVLPVITKTNGGTQINPGANTAYTVAIFNNSGGTLQDMVFTDPAVADLTVNSVNCAAANGATCPAVTVAAMQGAGIAIPPASLPDNSTLTFTVNATLSGTATVGNNLVNTATVAIGAANTSSTDTDLIVLAPSAGKSFAPSTITEGAASLLTVALTNPTAFAVTGVSFTDTYPSGMVNTAAAGGASSCGGTVTAANGGSSLALSGGTIPANGSCTVTVNVTSATAGSYSNSTGTVTHDSGTIPAASATLTVGVAIFGAFNACDDAPDPNITCTNTTTVTNSRITTKIAGVPFTLDLVALKTDGSRNTNYNNNVIVELLDASDNSGALDAYNCRSTWTTVIATLSPNPAFTNPDNGLITVGPFTVPEAYRNARVRVTNASGSFKRGCSTDNFAIRPNSFAVVPTDIDWATTGTSRTLNNTDITSPGSQVSTPNPIHKAGQPFTITATAKNALDVTTANYNVSVAPTAALSACSPGTACTASFGTLTPGTPAYSAGAVTWNAATYSDVGAFDLTLQDTDFTSVDAADTAASCAGRYVCSAATPVGRFVPDHFDLSGSALVNRSDINAGVGCSPASTFTYMGETMKTSFTLTAKNAVGSPTQNYAGSFAKFTNSIVNWIAGTGNDRVGLWAIATGYTYSGSTCKVLFDRVTPSVNSFAACSGAVPALPIGREAGPRVNVSSPSISAWVGGAATFIADATLERGDVPDGSYATLNIGVTPQDADGVALSAYDLDADNSGTDERASLGTAEVRFGRLKLSNAHGSELLNLPVPIQAQYWNGTTFVPNDADNCTVLASTHFALGNYQRKAGDTWTTSLTLVSTAAILGAWQINLSKPSPTPTGKGSVDLCVDLGADPGGGTVCSAAASANLPYLQGLWSPGSSYNNDPKVRATFGVFKGNEEFIYLREVY